MIVYITINVVAVNELVFNRYLLQPQPVLCMKSSKFCQKYVKEGGIQNCWY